MLKWLNPFDAGVFENVTEAQAEDAFSNFRIVAYKALFLGALMTQLAWTGLLIQMYRIGSNVVTIQLLAQQSWSTIGVFVLLLVFTLYLMKWITRTFHRFVVYLWGFTFNVRPDGMVRNYVYTARTKLYLALWALTMLVVHGLLTFMGLQGWFWFWGGVDGSFELSAMLSILMIIVLFAAFVIFPSMTIRVQEAAEVIEVMFTYRLIGMMEDERKFRHQLIKIATPLIAPQVAAQIMRDGPAAFLEWLSVPTDKWHDVAKAARIPVKNWDRVSGIYMKAARDGNRSAWHVGAVDDTGNGLVKTIPGNTLS